MSGYPYKNPFVGGYRITEPAELYVNPRPAATETSKVSYKAHAVICHAIANGQGAPTYIPKIEEFTPIPADISPQEMFKAESVYTWKGIPRNRFRSLKDNHHILIYTDGACSNNGKENAAAGCAFYYRPPGLKLSGEQTTGVVSFRLEDTGPNGIPSLQTSVRAELRAVIAALQYRPWYDPWCEMCSRVVIATDSEYVVKGVTSWVRTWIQNGWRISKGKLASNRDLWEELLEVLRTLELNDLEVQFWRIPREWNRVADKGAKAAAKMPRVADYVK
ncbi:hypothetical protein TWF506_001371 [Arthrobotrys conoides]|uniref:ribonuclease H n=1 Tax=Arthrobotrys conoides TaxID=74498 RepID=A0AAN8NND2_9PEZI